MVQLFMFPSCAIKEHIVYYLFYMLEQLSE